MNINGAYRADGIKFMVTAECHGRKFEIKNNNWQFENLPDALNSVGRDIVIMLKGGKAEFSDTKEIV